MPYSQILKLFAQEFGTSPLLIASPGRINLIGEHTDYNEGFVLPAAVDKSIYLAFAKNNSSTCRIFSADYRQSDSFSLSDITPRSSGWINFVMGVTVQLVAKGYPIGGFDCVFGGDIPIGAGMSSSAALENGVGLGLSELFDLNIPRLELVHHSQKAEHTFAGVQCGIMDMFASMMGKEGFALRLDCRSLDVDYVPLELGDYRLLLLNTRVEHSLGDSAYNERRQECEQGVAALRKVYPDVVSLRDASLPMLEKVRGELPGKVYDRCTYVVAENGRLLSACDALQKGDLEAFGLEMYGSHEGLSFKYEVSCPELDFLVSLAKEHGSVLGARMMGGGFGGCTLNLLHKDEVASFSEKARVAYKRKFNIDLEAYEVKTSDGTRRIL